MKQWSFYIVFTSQQLPSTSLIPLPSSNCDVGSLISSNLVNYLTYPTQWQATIPSLLPTKPSFPKKLRNLRKKFENEREWQVGEVLRIGDWDLRFVLWWCWWDKWYELSRRTTKANIRVGRKCKSSIFQWPFVLKRTISVNYLQWLFCL